MVKCNKVGSFPLRSKRPGDGLYWFNVWDGPMWVFDILPNSQTPLPPAPLPQFKTQRPCYAVDTRPLVGDTSKVRKTDLSLFPFLRSGRTCLDYPFAPLRLRRGSFSSTAAGRARTLLDPQALDTTIPRIGPNTPGF